MRRFSIIIFLFALIILASATAMVLIFHIPNVPTNVKDARKPANTPTTGPVSSDWQQYNLSYGSQQIEFEYPNSWYIQAGSEPGVIELWDTPPEASETKDCLPECFPQATISYETTSSPSLKDYATVKLRSEDLTFADVRSWHATSVGTESLTIIGIPGMVPRDEHLLKQGTTVVRLTFPSDSRNFMLDKIATTLRLRTR